MGTDRGATVFSLTYDDAALAGAKYYYYSLPT